MSTPMITLSQTMYMHDNDRWFQRNLHQIEAVWDGSNQRKVCLGLKPNNIMASIQFLDRLIYLNV